ncbi:hypothetical protein SDC9_199832 [bioreactor metagenome]|uniref:Uncharacterized protein n=1 Tax=bioreactor metagenome TaxID=1076179 RepID=A0A645ILK6_9ZZZZ
MIRAGKQAAYASRTLGSAAQVIASGVTDNLLQDLAEWLRNIMPLLNY